jgi:transposase InsO family protein
MPWKSMSVMDQRCEFVRLARAGGVSVTALCARFGISRQTGHQLLRRFEAEGQAGLETRSRRPHDSPRRVPAAVEDQVLALRTAHPAWGGRKIARRLADLGVCGVPSASTVSEILRRHGRLDLTESQRHRAFQRFERQAPNELWQMDFKGHFAIGSGRCHALTVIDDHCRYALGIRACGNETDQTVRGQLTQMFARYGLPEAILADNGAPWGSAGWHEARYTALGVWLLRLGIGLLHGRPRHPQTQGKDERFHRTLDVEVLQHNRFCDLAACQRAFDAWRTIYNEQRPHEALGLDVPASRYRASARSLPERLAEPDYAETDLVRRVQADGYVNFRGRRVKMSQAFAGLPVALRPTTTDGVWDIFFSRFVVAKVDLRDNEIHSQPVSDVSEHLSGMSPV